jgi:hypothetical protein
MQNINAVHKRKGRIIENNGTLLKKKETQDISKNGL